MLFSLLDSKLIDDGRGIERPKAGGAPGCLYVAYRESARPRSVVGLNKVVFGDEFAGIGGDGGNFLTIVVFDRAKKANI